MEDKKFGAQEIWQGVKELGDWFQNLDLKGVETAPDHFLGDYPSNKWQMFAPAIPKDLGGKTVLDVGCNAGFYSIEMKKRGASKVLGIDFDEYYLKQARFAAEVMGLDIEYRQMSVYEVADLNEKFDIVLFMGVFYHLRHPLLALDLLYEYAVRDLFIFQSMLRGSPDDYRAEEDYPFDETGIFEKNNFPRMHFIEKKYSNDETNWWLPNRACAEAMLRSSGFEVIEHPEKEVFICRKKEEKGELRSGRSGDVLERT